jgi:hypothetical protein
MDQADDTYTTAKIGHVLKLQRLVRGDINAASVPKVGPLLETIQAGDSLNINKQQTAFSFDATLARRSSGPSPRAY